MAVATAATLMVAGADRMVAMVASKWLRRPADGFPLCKLLWILVSAVLTPPTEKILYKRDTYASRTGGKVWQPSHQQALLSSAYT